MRPQSWLGSSNANMEENSKFKVMGAYNALWSQSTDLKCKASCVAATSPLIRPSIPAVWVDGDAKLRVLLSCHWKSSCSCSAIAKTIFLPMEPLGLINIVLSCAAEQRLSLSKYFFTSMLRSLLWRALETWAQSPSYASGKHPTASYKSQKLTAKTAKQPSTWVSNGQLLYSHLNRRWHKACEVWYFILT